MLRFGQCCQNRINHMNSDLTVMRSVDHLYFSSPVSLPPTGEKMTYPKTLRFTQVRQVHENLFWGLWFLPVSWWNIYHYNSCLFEGGVCGGFTDSNPFVCSFTDAVCSGIIFATCYFLITTLSRHLRMKILFGINCTGVKRPCLSEKHTAMLGRSRWNRNPITKWVKSLKVVIVMTSLSQKYQLCKWISMWESSPRAALGMKLSCDFYLFQWSVEK